MLTKLSVWWLTRQLRRDRDFWQSYQSNIACAIQDNYRDYREGVMDTKALHEFRNSAAHNFMQNWTRNR